MKLNKEEEAYLTMLRSSDYLREDIPHKPFWLTWKWATGLLIFIAFMFFLTQGA